jgi:hypothetical protein
MLVATPFFHPITPGEKAFEALLKHGLPVDIKSDRTQVTALFDRIVEEKEPSPYSRLLLEYGADPNVRDKEGRNLLFYDISLPAIQLLMKYNIDMNMVDNYGNSVMFERVCFTRVLDLTCGRRTIDVFEFLVRTRLENGADINETNKAGRNALFYADSLAGLGLLVQHGISIDHEDCLGRNALFCVTNSDVLKVLVCVYGLDINHTDERGMTALFYANSKSLVRMMVQLGINVDAKESCFNRNALFYVSNSDVFLELINYIDPKTTRDKDGKTPLFFVPGGRDEDLCRTMMKHIDPNAVDKGGKTCLFVNSNNVWFETLLEQVDVNIRDKSGNTALHATALAGDIQKVQMLLDHGADKTIRNNNGKTAFDMADGVEMRILLDTYEDGPPKGLLHCAICMENQPSASYHPCGHTLCRTCWKDMQQTRRKRNKDGETYTCHMCKAPVESVHFLYLS